MPAQHGGVACPKPEKRQPKARQRIRRASTPKVERVHISAVRTACVERDHRCRLWLPEGCNDDRLLDLFWTDCDGPSEWAHMHSRRRSQTRNQAPAVRHDAAHSLMLCRFHHLEYDAHRLRITALTRKGADGPLKFQRAT